MALRLKRLSASNEDAVRANALWNAFGLGLPLVLAFLFIPRLILGMGAERFGVLTLVLTFLNYFAFFDLGIGRALTQLLAGKARGDHKEEAALIWTVSALLCGMGAVLAVGVWFLAPLLVHDLLRVRGPLAGESIAALRALGAALPFLLHGLALRGVLESQRRFDLSNLVRIPAGVFTFGAPLLMLPFTRNVAAMTLMVLLGRLLAWALNLWMVFRILPHVRSMARWKPGDVWAIMRFGGWYTVSNVVSPIIDGMDRFFVGRLLSVSRVAYYTTPFEVIVKLSMLSGSVAGAIFPEFAARLEKGPGEAALLLRRGLKYILTLLFPFVLVATAYAQEGLTWWLNPEFAAISAPVLRWLSIYVFLTGAALVPLVFLQGAGRPDLSARMHLIELPVHAALLYLLIRLFGLPGAAMAVAARMLIDFLGMLWFAGGVLRFRGGDFARILLPMGGAVAALLFFHLPLPALAKALALAAALAAYVALAWAFVLEPRDQQRARELVGKLRKRRARRSSSSDEGSDDRA